MEGGGHQIRGKYRKGVIVQLHARNIGLREGYVENCQGGGGHDYTIICKIGIEGVGCGGPVRGRVE